MKAVTREEEEGNDETLAEVLQKAATALLKDSPME